jgi:integrase
MPIRPGTRIVRSAQDTPLSAVRRNITPKASIIFAICVTVHNYLGGPLRRSTINEEFRRVLCKSLRGRVLNDIGLESFSVHWLRHTLASNLSSNGADANTTMTCLGWVSLASVDGYTKLDENSKIAGFIDATNKVEQQAADGFGKRVLTSEEFLLFAGENAA